MAFENFGNQFLAARQAGTPAISQFLSKQLNLKQAFNDAVRQFQLKDMSNARQSFRDRQTAILQGGFKQGTLAPTIGEDGTLGVESVTPTVEPFKESGITKGARSKLLGALKNKEMRGDFGFREVIDTREKAEEVLRRGGYINFQDDPEIMAELDKFPRAGGDAGTINESTGGSVGFGELYDRFIEEFGGDETKAFKAIIEHQNKQQGQ